MFLFTRVLIVDCQMAQGAAAQVARVESPATSLGCEAALDADAQPVGIGQFGAMALMNAVGKQVESW